MLWKAAASSLVFSRHGYGAGRGARRATGMEALSHHFRQEGDDGGNQVKITKVNQEHEQIGHDLGCNLVNRNAGDRGDHKEVEADRRVMQPMARLMTMSTPKEHRVNAHAQRHRQKIGVRMTTAAEALIRVPIKSSRTLTSIRKTRGFVVMCAKLSASMCGTWALVESSQKDWPRQPQT